MPSLAIAQNTTRVSVASDGSEGNNDSFTASISADGRYVTFESRATNLVSGDANDDDDVFVRDTQGLTTERINLLPDNSESSVGAQDPFISADGRYVAFSSTGTNLVPGDQNSASDIFVRDRTLGTTERVSINSNEGESNGGSFAPTISENGRYVAFESSASNLTSGDSNLKGDVFVRDRQNGTTILASGAAVGVGGTDDSFDATISGDGSCVAFSSRSSNLIPEMSYNNQYDIYVYEIQSGELELVSTSTLGLEGDGNSLRPSISHNGRYVAFWSDATTMVLSDYNGVADVFVHDRQTGATERVSVVSDGAEADDRSFNPSISGDGRYVTFRSGATNLVVNDSEGQPDIFIHDRNTHTTRRLSVGFDGNGADAECYAPVISQDGYYVAYQSSATNLVSNDNNTHADIFLTFNSFLPTPIPTPTRVPVPIDNKPKKTIQKIIKEDIEPIVQKDRPIVEVNKRRANISYTRFKITERDEALAKLLPGSLIIPSWLTARKRGEVKLRYQVKAKRTRGAKKQIIKRTIRRNTVTFKKLKPGSYKVRYRLEVTRTKKVIAKTYFSGSTTFTIEKR